MSVPRLPGSANLLPANMDNGGYVRAGELGFRQEGVAIDPMKQPDNKLVAQRNLKLHIFKRSSSPIKHL